MPLPGTSSGTITHETDITLIPMKKKSFIFLKFFYIHSKFVEKFYMLW